MGVLLGTGGTNGAGQPAAKARTAFWATLASQTPDMPPNKFCMVPIPCSHSDCASSETNGDRGEGARNIGARAATLTWQGTDPGDVVTDSARARAL
eukprot:5637146-Prymnesium_polylepis.1